MKFSFEEHCRDVGKDLLAPNSRLFIQGFKLSGIFKSFRKSQESYSRLLKGCSLIDVMWIVEDNFYGYSGPNNYKPSRPLVYHSNISSSYLLVYSALDATC